MSGAAWQTEQTDLTKLEGDPTENATVGVHLESADVTIGPDGLRATARSVEGSAQSAAVTTLILIGAAAVLIGTAAGIGLPHVGALIVGLSVPVGIYLLIRFTGRIGRR